MEFVVFTFFALSVLHLVEARAAEFSCVENSSFLIADPEVGGFIAVHPADIVDGKLGERVLACTDSGSFYPLFGLPWLLF